MDIDASGALTKLTIELDNDAPSGGETFEVMFNPETYSETFAAVYTKENKIDSGIEEYSYVKSLPQEFKLKIIIDGTGVSTYHPPSLPVFSTQDQTVYQRVNQFLKLTWYPQNGQPNPLVIKWNVFIYYCMLKDVTINYTLFSRGGLPLRAELDANFIGNSKKNKEYYDLRLNASSNSSSVSTNTGNSSATTPTVPTKKQAAPQNVQNGITISVS